MSFFSSARILRILFALWCGLSALSSWAAENTCSASYITDQIKGEETIDQFGAHDQTINVFSFEFNGDCHVVAKSPWVEQAAGRLRDDPKRLVLIDIVNEIEPTPGACRDLTPGEMIQMLLSDPVKRAAHIREVAAIGALGQGVEIDYEHVLSATTPYYTQFLQELRAALPAEKKLAAVVQPKGSGELGTPIDWRAIEPYVDYIRVMAYYYSYKSSPPGPVITYAQLGKLADYILNSPTQSIPRGKARILLSLYGWDWPVSPAGPGKLIRYEEAVSILQANGITPQRDAAQDTLHFQYRDSGGVLHEVWFNDFVAEQKRVQLLLDRDFPAIDLWHLNTGDPALWQWFTPLVRSDCPSLAAPPSPATAARLERVDPMTVKAADPATLLTLSGTGFSSSDVVLVNGNPIFPSSVGPASMQITISAAYLQKPMISHVAIAQNGRLSNVLNFQVVGNPVLGSFDPPTAQAGAGAFTLSLRGNGFEPGSSVRWDNQDLSVQFISASELRVNIAASLVTQPATVRIGVINPTSGARISRSYTVGQTTAVNTTAPAASFGVGPNPWTAGKNTGGIHFFGVSEGNEIKIFTTSGNFVRSVPAPGGSAEWDLTNESGEKVASGLYIYLATRPDGAMQRGTLAVIH